MAQLNQEAIWQSGHLETAVASSCKFVHVMRVTSGLIGSQRSLYALW